MNATATETMKLPHYLVRPDDATFQFAQVKASKPTYHIHKAGEGALCGVVSSCGFTIYYGSSDALYYAVCKRCMKAAIRDCGFTIKYYDDEVKEPEQVPTDIDALVADMQQKEIELRDQETVLVNLIENMKKCFAATVTSNHDRFNKSLRILNQAQQNYNRLFASYEKARERYQHAYHKQQTELQKKANSLPENILAVVVFLTQKYMSEHNTITDLYPLLRDVYAAFRLEFPDFDAHGYHYPLIEQTILSTFRNREAMS